MNKFQELIKNFAYTISSNLLSILISVIVVLIVPKLIGVKQYGYWQLYAFYTTYVGVFPLGWLDGVYLRLGGITYEKLDKKLMYSQFVMYSVSQTVIAVIIFIFSMLLVHDNQKAIILMLSSVCLVLYNVRAFLLIILQSANRIKKYATLTIEDRVIYMIVLVAMILFSHKSFVMLIIADLVAKVITMIHSMIFCKDISLRNVKDFTPDFKETWINITVGIKLLIANFAGLLIIGIIRFAIQHYWGIVTFGKLSLTLTISSLLVTFISAISLVLFPTLRRIGKEKIPMVYENMRVGIVFILGLSLLIYFPMDYILPFWLPKYKDSLIYMAILFPVCFFDGKFELLTNTFMKTLRMEKKLLIINLVTVFISFVLTMINVEFFKNLNFMVLSVVIVLCFRSTLGEILVSQETQVNFMQDIVLELILSFGFIVSTWYLSIARAFISYIALILIYAIIKRFEIKNMISLVAQSKRGKNNVV